MNCVLYAILARTEILHFVVNGRFMHRRSHFTAGLLNAYAQFSINHTSCKLTLDARASAF